MLEVKVLLHLKVTLMPASTVVSIVVAVADPFPKTHRLMLPAVSVSPSTNPCPHADPDAPTVTIVRVNSP
jgi:hypothetical protein